MKKISNLLIIMFLACLILALTAFTVSCADEDPSDFDELFSERETSTLTFWGFTGLVCIVIPLIALIIGIVLAVWVYKDAQKRGSSGALWLIIVIFTGIIGLIIWLVVRPPIGGEKKAASSERRCPNCGRVIPDDARACPYCAKKFEG